MLPKIVWLWFEDGSWHVSFCRWSNDFDNHGPTINYNISIDRAYIIEDIMYKMHKLGICEAPYAAIRYSGETNLSVCIK
jgi:hypothetical protein